MNVLNRYLNPIESKRPTQSKQNLLYFSGYSNLAAPEQDLRDEFEKIVIQNNLNNLLPKSATSLEFASDHNMRVHPEFLLAIMAACMEDNASYGHDRFTLSAASRVKQVFGINTLFIPIATGTGSINVALASILDPTKKVVASDICHTHSLQGNALAISTHTTPLLVPSDQGKINPETVDKMVRDYRRPGSPLTNPFRVLYIAQPTEIGTIYEPEEIKALANYAHKNDMLLFMDGARFWNAVAALRRKYPERNYDMKDLSVNLGVDAMTLGGTKNGMLACESILYFDEGQSQIAHRIFSDPEFQERIEIWKRQLCSRTSKTEPFTAQYIRALQQERRYGNFGIRLADHANQLARYLFDGLKTVDGVLTVKNRPVETNSVYILIPKSWYPEFRKAYAGFDKFSIPGIEEEYPDHQLVRYMAGATSTKEGADEMIRQARLLASKVRGRISG